jgi:hypothetical protein
MNNTATPVKPRKTRYDLNFKRSAVELWQSSGKSAATQSRAGLLRRQVG